MGLLDALSSDDAKLGIGLLAAGGYSPTPMSTGQRLQMALAGASADKQNALKLKLLQSQVDENASQNALRQAQLSQQQKRDAYFMGDGGLGGSSSAPAVPGASAGVGGLPGSPSGMAPTAAGGDRFSQWAAQYGIPRDALVNDYLTNGGKGIAEMIAKRGTPDMQVSNGYAYDKNKVGAGFLPQLNVSQNGQTSMVRIGPDGLPVVSAPEGAVNTFGAYKGIEDRSRAANTPGRPTILPGGRMGGQSQLSEINGSPPGPAVGTPTAFTGLPQAQAGVTGNFSGDQSAIVTAIANIRDPQERSNAIAAFEQQMRASPASMNSPVAGGGVEFSPAEKAAQAAQQATVVEQAKADVVPAADKRKAIDSGNDALRTIDKALNHPGLSAGTGLQGTLDPRNYIPGTDARNFSAVRDQLKGQTFLQAYSNLKGGGQITEVEGTKAENAIARLDKAQSTSEFVSALKDLRDVVDRGLRRTRGESVPDAPLPNNGASSKSAGKVVDSLPTPNASNKGQRIRDTATGKILRSNGLQWKEE